MKKLSTANLIFKHLNDKLDKEWIEHAGKQKTDKGIRVK